MSETPSEPEIITISDDDSTKQPETEAATATDEPVDAPDPEQNEDEDEEFGDFDDFDDFAEPTEASTTPAPAPAPTAPHNSATPESPIACLSETDFKSSAQLYESITSIISPITSRKQDEDEPPRTTTAKHNSSTPLDPASYFNPRSASLWNQLLVVTAHDRPLDWKRSSIRKLFLVSLGVPLDLDEIMPNRNTKRLVLPSAAKHSSKGKDEKGSNKEGEEFDSTVLDSLVSEWELLANVSSMALDGMDEQEVESHMASLKAATTSAQEWLDTLTTKKESASKDKETFESVIESLVEYASRLRTTKKSKK